MTEDELKAQIQKLRAAIEADDEKKAADIAILLLTEFMLDVHRMADETEKIRKFLR